MLGAVAKRYAGALFELALESGRLEEIDNQSEMLLEVFADRGLLTFFQAPQISAEQKKGVLDKRLKGQLDASLLNLLKVLVDNNRADALVDILRYFNLMTDQHRGVEDVTLVSAVPLQQAQVDAIVAQVKRFSRADDLRVAAEVDDGVIGGVKVLLGESQVIDGTVSTRLRELRDRMVRFRHSGTGS